MIIDDGPDPDVTPHMLDILDQYGAKATFFYVGESAQWHPRYVKATVARGHVVENHSQRHRHTFLLRGPDALRCETIATQDTLTQITSARLLFFRTPARLRNSLLGPALCQPGLQLAS